jgi:rRNA maturation protein Rpf1
MKRTLVTVSKNSSLFLYSRIREVFKNPIIIRRGRKNTEKLIEYALFMGFDRISIVSKINTESILRINELKISTESQARKYKSKIYFYDLNGRKKIFLNNKGAKGRKRD